MSSSARIVCQRHVTALYLAYLSSHSDIYLCHFVTRLSLSWTIHRILCSTSPPTECSAARWQVEEEPTRGFFIRASSRTGPASSREIRIAVFKFIRACGKRLDIVGSSASSSLPAIHPLGERPLVVCNFIRVSYWKFKSDNSVLPYSLLRLVYNPYEKSMDTIRAWTKDHGEYSFVKITIGSCAVQSKLWHSSIFQSPTAATYTE